MMEYINKLLQRIGDSLNGLKNIKPTQNTWTNLTKVKNVVILSDVTDKDTAAAIVNLRSELRKLCPEAKVLMLSYYDKKVCTEVNNFVSNQGIVEYFTNDDFSFFYKIESESLKTYLNEDYDMAIMIAKGSKEYVPYLFKYIRAALRIGNKSTNNSLMNFVINADTRTLEETNKEIVRYLQMFFS